MNAAEEIAELLRAEGKTVEVVHGGKAGGGMDEATIIIIGNPSAEPPAGVMQASMQKASRAADRFARKLNAVMKQPEHSTIRGTNRLAGRNALCPCRSGKKYKHCCGRPKDSTRARKPDPPRVQATPEVFTDGIMEIDGEQHSLERLKRP